MMRLLQVLLAILLAMLLPTGAASSPNGTSGIAGKDLMRLDGRIYVAQVEDQAFPRAQADIARWERQRTAVPRVSLFGGAYWLSLIHI